MPKRRGTVSRTLAPLGFGIMADDSWNYGGVFCVKLHLTQPIESEEFGNVEFSIKIERIENCLSASLNYGGILSW